MDKTFDGLDDFYTAVSEIGRGAFGTVFEVEREGDGKRFAVKAFAAENTAELEKVRSFKKRGISGDRLVSVVEVGTDFAVFELLPTSLETFLESRPDEAVQRRLVEEVLSALGELHDLGIVHGDVKPSNLMIEFWGEEEEAKDLRVKLIDFGLASGMDNKMLELSFSGSVGVEGTLDYLSPERREPGHRPDPRDDLFSAGVVFFQILTGRPAREALVRKGELAPVFQAFLAAEEDRPRDARKALVAVWDHWREGSREARVERIVYARKSDQWVRRKVFNRGFVIGVLAAMFPGFLFILAGMVLMGDPRSLNIEPAYCLLTVPVIMFLAYLLPTFFTWILTGKLKPPGSGRGEG